MMYVVGLLLMDIKMLARGDLNYPTAVTNSFSFTSTKLTQVATTTQLVNQLSTFSYYVDGLYGFECILRIASYTAANNLTVSMDDLSCACLGECPFPLNPNPKAVAWFLKTRTAQSFNIEIDYLNKNIVFLIITAIVVLFGILG